ncbi:MAG: response regulator [Rheinheimera sp.]|nr:MAG: response regulator [Rheinheimera sp.]
MRILLVEDDLLLADGIRTALQRMNYQTEHCTRGSELVAALKTSEFGAVVLDLGLADGSSLPLIEQLRRAGQTVPVLVLTALDDIDIELKALNAGAGDYLSKPFDLRELEVRLRVLARRHQDRTDDELNVAGIRLNLVNQRCWFAGRDVTLTNREYILLKEFMQHPDKIRSRQLLEELCYGWDGDIDSNATEVHIHNLRKKFGSSFVKTVRGVGYMLVSRHD